MDSDMKIKGDISELSNVVNTLEQELIKTKERAEESEKLKSAFLNNISHEIRTPLNGILGFLDFFNDDLAKEEREQFVAIMRKNGERLLKTVDNIIELSKLESGIIKVSNSIFNLNAALKEFNNVINQKYSNSNVQYICIFEAFEGQILVEGDRFKIFQILRNLIDNAFKFTKKGYIKLTVKLEKDTLILEVEDTGIGIRKEDRNAIFEPFRQSDFNLNRKYEGNGLGLTISKQLIHLMGGELTNESPAFKGAKFKCSFPGVFVHNIKKNDDLRKVYTAERAFIENELSITGIGDNDYSFFKTVC